MLKLILWFTGSK